MNVLFLFSAFVILVAECCEAAINENSVCHWEKTTTKNQKPKQQTNTHPPNKQPE